MAPVGSYDSLSAAIAAGADAVYFGVQGLNMRSRSSANFTLDDLRNIASIAAGAGVKTYLTVNTIVYDNDLQAVRETIAAAAAAGITAVIASDIAVISECRRQGVEVHISTQCNVSNIEAVRFYAAFADVVVLARELSLDQVKAISDAITAEDIRGPRGELVRIEMFCHGALCMAVSGKCYLSLDNLGRSANRGECMQVCRRSYTVRDRETGVELDVDNKYIMSPKDLKTIGFIDKMADAGVRVFKIEGRARSAEYVYTVVSCYKEALAAVEAGTFNENMVDHWDQRLSTVFNRGFWDGYYLGRRLGEWSGKYGSNATEKKVYVGKGIKYFSRLGVGEFYIEAGEVCVGDRLVIIGPTTGVVYIEATEIHFDNGPVEKAVKGQAVSIPVSEKIRPSDKLYKLVAAD